MHTSYDAVGNLDLMLRFWQEVRQRSVRRKCTRIRRNITGVFLKKIMKTRNHYNRSSMKSIAPPNQLTFCSSVCLHIYHQLQIIYVLIHEVSCLKFTERHVVTMVTSSSCSDDGNKLCTCCITMNPSPLTHTVDPRVTTGLTHEQLGFRPKF
jgi:hypothetical protein